MATLLWFQRDLRLHDNPALNWALQQGKPLIAIYVHSPEEDTPWAPGAASRWWLHHSLKKLSDDLLQTGITLQFFKANSIDIIPQLVNDYDVDSVAWTDRHEPQRINIESVLEKQLLTQGKIVKRFKDELLTYPNEFLTLTKNTPYKVFTPFYKKIRKQLRLTETMNTKIPTTSEHGFLPSLHAKAVSLQQLELVDDHPWQQKLHQYWSPGEKEGLQKLDFFVTETLNRYSTQRDYPAVNGTSSLSPHLHFGEISPRQIVNTLAPLIEFHGGNIANEAEIFLRQLIWREFARYILWHFPETSTEPMNKKYKKSFWKSNKTSLKKWQQGNTGIPIIDASMKQLWETGFMHNRMRMLVASLLTKNMGINWQDGARWFWDTLVDADLANNTMGWQWVAGCGVDAAPYFRIFNPNTQAQKFDKKNIYVNRWLTPTTLLHTSKAIVDLSDSRKNALDRYNRMIRLSN